MGAKAGIIGCGAYSIGLLIVSLLVNQGAWGLWVGVLIAGVLTIVMAIGLALFLPHHWRTGPQPSLWLGLGLVGLFAVLNYGFRYPTPTALDISHLLQSEEAAGTQQEVWGQVGEMPKIARSGKGQFWLKVNQVQRLNDDKALAPAELAQGKLYVTVPQEAIETLYPGQKVAVTGKLYAPASAKNPNAFNFQQYLANHRTYAGFSGKWVDPVDDRSPPGWGLWRIRQRIVNAHKAGIGDEAGPLVSAMALGRRAVQVPYDLQDAFIQAGLAHTLAASGFHVSLVLGLVLGIMSHPAILTRFSNPGVAKLIAGSLALAGYVFLTGVQPSVMRAALMGMGALVGLALERKVKPLGCLLLAVTLLLVWNPSWIDDIGFRLSVMATLGLMVSVKPIAECLSWLPTTLATLVAVPLAAYFWTIPLSLFYFNTLTTYSILLNMVATPLVTVISLGGILSGLVALLAPGIGSMLAWVLWLPTHLLIWLVHWEISLPGSALATGHISLLQMFGLYGLYTLGGWQRWWRQRRWLVGVLLLLLAFGPLWYRAITHTEITVLAAGQDAVMLVQDRRSTLLVNSGTENTAFYTVTPFLRQAGINRITDAIAGAHSDSENWQTIMAKAPIRNFYMANPPLAVSDQLKTPTVLALNQPLSIGEQTVESLSTNANVLKFTFFRTHTWLMMAGLDPAGQNSLIQTCNDLNSEVLWWDGQPLSRDFLITARPQIAIASTRQLSSVVEEQLTSLGIHVYCPERDGAILWNPALGYHAYLTSAQTGLTTLE